MGIGREPSNSWNPQGNSVLERIHQVFGDMLRTFGLGNVVLDGNEPLQKSLAGTAYAIRSSYNTTQGATPAQMVFGRDMVLPVDFSIDWDGVTRRKQKRINGSCGREDRRRIDHTHKPGDKVLLEKPKKILRELENVRRGPFTVIKHKGNGTVDIQMSPCVTENVNIRRLDPFFE